VSFSSATPVELLDTVKSVDTPEGCRMGLRVAGPVSRARAWLIDFFIRVAIYLTAAQFLVYFQKIGMGAMYVLVFALEWFYPTVFEVLWRGATPGKRACKLAVLRDDGTPVDWGASFIRNTLRAIDFLPFFYGFGLISMMATRDYKRLGDLAAGTVVVYVDDPTRIALDAVGEAEAPPVPLSVPEQRALIEYVLRAPRLTRERAEELATLAQPITGGLAPHEASERLARIGRFLLGRR
jgi:uncharacterized RDD family membrane protein YckC